jgi:phage-related protein
MVYFRTVYLDGADQFMETLGPKLRKKILAKIKEAEEARDPGIFKKLNNEIWEFRIRWGIGQIRLLAFWDKTDKEETLVVATHGFIKKTDKVPGNEIVRAQNIRRKYFENKME